MHNNEKKLTGKDKIRAKIEDYKRSADVARRQAEQTHLQMVREAYIRMEQGYVKLANELERTLKRPAK